jgi:transposase-like protein
MSEKIVQLNEEVIKVELKELVRSSVEETLNGLLEQEAQQLTNAAKYERSQGRQGYRSGHYSRNLTTTSGDVEVKMPKLKGVSFETAIIERYRRRESSVEEALIEMYLAGVSVRRVEDITEALWGSKVSPATISELNKKAYVHIEDWRNRPLAGSKYPYVYVDGIYLRRNWGGEYENVAILVAIAVNEDGYREVIGAAEGMKEDKQSWVNFLVWLRNRGLSGVKLVVGDKCLGMLEAVGEVFPDAKYQRCTVHFYRNVFSVTPRSKVKLAAKMLKTIHAQESKKAAREKAKNVIEELRAMKLAEAAKKVEDGIEETLTCADFPFEHGTRIRTKFGAVSGKSDYFGVIRSAWKKGLSLDLLETAYITSARDMDIYLASKERVADAIARGIVEGYGKAYKPPAGPMPGAEPEQLRARLAEAAADAAYWRGRYGDLAAAVQDLISKLVVSIIFRKLDFGL